MKEKKLGYCILTLLNMGGSLYVLGNFLLGIFSEFFWGIFIAVIITFTILIFVIPSFDRLAGILAGICGFKIDDIDEMSYGERTLRLSFIVFFTISKIIGWMSSILNYLVTIIMSFAFWLASGEWFEGGLDAWINAWTSANTIAKFLTRLYDLWASRFEIILGKIIEWEKKACDYIWRYKEKEPNIEGLPPVRLDRIQKDALYNDNIEKAQQGNAKAQVIVGEYLLQYNQIREGLKWLNCAVRQKEETAYTAYGNIYMKGLICKKNVHKAVYLYKLGVKGKDPSAMYLLAMFYMGGDLTEATKKLIEKLLYTSANMGEEMAQAELGELYFEGRCVEKNEKKAFYWLNRAVMENQKYKHAGYHLSQCYLYGIGIEEDRKKGFQILKNSVEEKCRYLNKARELIAECYQNGYGVKKNTRKALEYRNHKAYSEKLLMEIAESP